MALTKDILGLGRTKSGELSVAQRSAIIYAHQAGATQSKLALDFSDRTRHLLFILARRHPFWSYKTLSCAIPGQKGRF
ncbi:hypothetical protein DTO013E5_2402 [Penicillium roqueforti]|uniref:uncharacterized protein n=1 Tax=Penicillium roqueforti TaxID=5082 RepID=UPI00190C7D51|nr:uncharacterized protein LCP9604111_2494 [Penicillium roqueforti]KAF9251093.1 hypothetical protein LCP9604111_2494 [Penicillium roqueforti]KAI1838049.1 hypothetical protein CBS147337_1272 [Penicillium roqueforti]KAI2718718.1 hypothetical protein CBS147318_3828 [Penicillium roqueforti]KAI2727501.1 hypothetical protein CBS147354_3174 [Penicillium roqueforti]KAI2741564.1 hypothetical protein DTO013F2_8774 [Penicillium roqueforti]